MALTPVPTIDPALPVPPNPADEEAVFDAKAYAWSNALPGFGGDVKAIGDATYANAQWAETKAGEAATQAGLATTNGAAQVALAAAQVDLAAAQVDLATEQADLATSNGAAQVALAAAQVAIAAGHASDAADSATAASASATEAAGLVEKYQGSLAADPVLDKNGGPLSNGDWYVSTVTGVIRAYTVAGGWVNGLSAVAGVTSVNGNSGAITGVVTETGAQSLTEKTLVNPLLFLGGSNGTAGQVPISQGAGLPVIWGAGSEIIRSVRTSNTAISAANKGNLIDITSGTFTQTFSAASTLGNGWFCYIRNSGTGDITLDPNASELIDGLISYVMYPGECRLVQCDGVALRTVVLNSFYKVFTASGNFIKPPGYSLFEGLLWGGGGGGTRTDQTAGGGGGGGGACAQFSLVSSLIASSQSFVIGSGGVGGAPYPVNKYESGGTGGNSSIGGLIEAYGGGGGGGGLESGTNFFGGGGGGIYSAGIGAQGIINNGVGGLGGSSASSGGDGGKSTEYGGAGGAFSGIDGPLSVFGGGGGGGGTSWAPQKTGGISRFGGNGGAGCVGSTTPPGNGVAPGGGGGAGNNTFSGGNGARGELRIWGII